MKAIGVLTLTLMAIAPSARAHSEMYFALMQVERTIEVTTSAVQMHYDCRLTTPVVAAAMRIVDRNSNGEVEPDEKTHLWISARDYLEADLVLYAGREKTPVRRRTFAPAQDGDSCVIALEASLPETEEDIHMTLVDPAFLFPPIGEHVRQSPTRGVSQAPAALVVDGVTTDSVTIESSPASVFVIRRTADKK